MTKHLWRLIGILSLLLIPAMATQAQDNVQALPVAYRLNGFVYEGQWWNNCGPATMTMALTYFGYSDNQGRAQNYLKPNLEDKNVTPTEMVNFVNDEVPEIPVYALRRVGGDLNLLKTLLANNFPVILEEGYDPPGLNQGWMGHYLLAIGFDDSVGVVTTHDSYDGESLNYSYEHITEYWQHFNYTYIVLYNQQRLPTLLSILGEDPLAFNPTTGAHYNEVNTINALNIAIQEASADDTDSFAWFNVGTNYVQLAEIEAARGNVDIEAEYYRRAVTAYDKARSVGLPFRMMWYQFGIYEAYYAVGRYDDMLAIAQTALNDGGGHLVEETLYYGGLAREGKGELQRALRNYNSALQINANHVASQRAKDNVLVKMNG